MKNAASGVKHWWAQRLTAIALVPLSLWFVAGLIAHAGAGRAEVVSWLADPAVAVLMIVTLVAALYHAVLGVEEVILDYVHAGFARQASLVLLKLFGALLIAAAVVSVLLIAVSGR